VIGAWLWDHELGFGITTEIDADEAYHALRATRHAMLVLSTSIILLLIGLVTIYILYQERRKAEAALRERETLFRVLLEGVGADYLIYRVGFDRVLQYLTPAIERFTGVAMQTAVKMEWWELFNVTPETLHQIKQLDEKLQQGQTNESHYDASYMHPDGTLRTVEASERPEFDVHGRRIAILGIIKDVTARNKTEQELRRAATVFDNTDEGIIVTDADRHITVINKAVTKITGYKQNEVLGKTPHFQKSGRHDQAFYESLWETIERDGKWRGEIWNRRRNGEIYPAWENITAVKDEHGHISNYVAVFSDISAIKESEERLAHLAHHDSLTGLPNRLRFIANLEQALESAKRHKHKVAVMFLDLDRFKLINDTLGHSFGDELLKSIAGRLKSTVRSEDTVARLGGDEFTIILHEIGRSEDSALIAEKVINTTRQPVCLGGEDISVSTSIGISIYPDDSDNSDGLVKAADAAMYHAKNSGRSNFQFYTFDLTSRALEHLALENGLRQALEKNEFVLHYQPQVAMCSERISGVEALIRWQHPERGLLMPASFMKVANETGLIDPMSEWVLRTACSDLVQWRFRGLPPTRIAVNISGRQLMHEPSIRRIVTFLDEIDPHPGSLGLDLEVTEASIEFAERAMEIMRQLKERGVMLAIDDFGTGHSSLSRLKELPVDTLKIDRSFIQNIAKDPDDRVIASTIIAMAHSLGLRVVAEGVETEEQLSILRALNCDEIQGFYYSKPIPAAQMVLLLEQQLTGA
jgi:diguanylate cyclase (GGDEF)-like protein/PAS domain S-box-containing protein